MRWPIAWRRSSSASAPSTPATRPARPTVDPETRERLAALGYIGSFTNTPAVKGKALPDPKDKIDIFNLMTSAQESNGEDETEAAIVRLKKVVAQDPNILDAWVMLGNEYLAEARFPVRARAVPSARSRSTPSTTSRPSTSRMPTARSVEYDAALLGYERYLGEGSRGTRSCAIRWARSTSTSDRLDEAESAFRQALSDDTRVAAARNALGVVALKRGDLAGAEKEIRAALAQKPDVPLAHFNLALVAEQRGDFQTAAAEYQKEIDMQADAFKAAFNLAKLREQLGDAAGQEAAYRKAIELNPRFAEGYFYLAKLYLDQGRAARRSDLRWRGAASRSVRASEYAPLGHYVLADIYSRRGMMAESRGGRREASAAAERGAGEKRGGSRAPEQSERGGAPRA